MERAFHERAFHEGAFHEGSIIMKQCRNDWEHRRITPIYTDYVFTNIQQTIPKNITSKLYITDLNLYISIYFTYKAQIQTIKEAVKSVLLMFCLHFFVSNNR